MSVCTKCHKLISESHYERHLKRCGTSHKHVAQSLYVPSATAQIESPNRGITYGPPSASWNRKSKWLLLAIVAVLALAAVLGTYFVF
jgi:phage FluMu protein Com